MNDRSFLRVPLPTPPPSSGAAVETPTGTAHHRAPAFSSFALAELSLMMRLFVPALVLSAVGCSPSLGGAVRAYEHGRYPEAMEELRAVPAEGCHGAHSDTARYALYRGLTSFALGDLATARLWLDRVARATDADPALLSADDAGRFASARAHLPR